MSNEEYKIISMDEHVKSRSGMYIGQISLITDNEYVYDNKTDKFVIDEIKYSPGAFKLFDEIISNAYDNIFKQTNMTTIKIIYTKQFISIYNDGCQIPIKKYGGNDKTYSNKYIPEIIFSCFHSSSNYDDSKKRISSGLNGLGAKLCNAFSDYFKIHIQTFGNSYEQEWSDKMKNISNPIIKKVNTELNDIIVTYKMSKTDFGNEYYDLEKKIIKKCFDIIGCSFISGKKIKLYYNNKLLPINNSIDYINKYITNSKTYHKLINNKFELIVAKNDGNLKSIYFVNSIQVRGKYLENIANQIYDHFINEVIDNEKKANYKIRLRNFIKKTLFIFINLLVENAEFKGQTKDELSIDPNTHGCDTKINNATLKQITEIINITDEIKEFICNIDKKLIISSDKKNVNSKTTIIKCDNAVKAGTKESYKCSLIVTEGDSAKTLADMIVSYIKDGRLYFGTFPLRGKLLNTLNASNNEILNNKEIAELKQIIGLVHGVDYSDINEFNKLKYGSIIIMTDQDVDGIHIKGLIINFIHSQWPQLLKINGFIKCFVTPLVITTNKTNNSKNYFYCETDYNDWKNKCTNINKWSIKYYKGLATSGKNEAEYYHKNLEMLIKYYYSNLNMEEIKKLFNLGFNKNLSDERKLWLNNYVRSAIIDYKQKSITYEDYINKELKHFSQSDVSRSIVNIMDGLKISQRKILYCAFLRKLTNEIKVSQFAGYVSENSSYHHGEESLNLAIILLGYNFVGSNNINLLETSGQLGTRTGSIKGFGKNHGSPRYIYTKLHPITRKIFIEIDDHILEYLDDDGFKIEPRYYLPIIPMCLVNGSIGIGTGWSTNIPKYNVFDIINIMNYIIKNKRCPDTEPIPYYRNWNGKIESVISENGFIRYFSIGKFNVDPKNNIIYITELPVMETTYNFKKHLNKLIINGTIKKFENLSKENDESINFAVYPISYIDDIISTFKLKKPIKYNIVVIDTNDKIITYKKITYLIMDFINRRLGYYQLRKTYLLKKINLELKILLNKKRFITEIMDEKLIIKKKSEQIIDALLTDSKYDKINDTYNYLLNMSIRSFSLDKINELQKKITELENENKKYTKYTIYDFYENDINNLLDELKTYNH